MKILHGQVYSLSLPHSTEGEDMNASEIMNTPYRPFLVTYSFEESPHLRFDN